MRPILNSNAATQCSSCYGEGTVFQDYGPQTCPDCRGLGALPSASVLAEQRLRELEQRYEPRDPETWRDVRWLVQAVRGAHDTLLKILAVSQDAALDDPIAKNVRFLANEVLGVYAPSEPGRSEPSDEDTG
jgi:hypothetical protein